MLDLLSSCCQPVAKSLHVAIDLANLAPAALALQWGECQIV